MYSTFVKEKKRLKRYINLDSQVAKDNKTVVQTEAYKKYHSNVWLNNNKRMVKGTVD